MAAKKKTAKKAPKKKLDLEVARFLVLLSFDEKFRKDYQDDPEGFVAQWPHKLLKDAKQKLITRNTEQVSLALISQFGTTNFLAGRKATKKKATKKR
jgi:hypothetical protein